MCISKQGERRLIEKSKVKNCSSAGLQPCISEAKASRYISPGIGLLAVVLTFSFLLLTSLCYAQNEERLTLTTYYPAPYGTYQQLVATDKLLVCDTADVATNLGDMSDTSPDAAFMGNVGIGVTDPYTKLQFGSENDRISWRTTGGIINATIAVESIDSVDYIKTEQFVAAPSPAPFLSAYHRIAENADLSDRSRDWFIEPTDLSLRIYRGSVLNRDASSLHIVTDASGENLQGVGIGTNNPGATLDVNGDVNVSGDFTWAGDNSGSNYIRIGDLQICWGRGLSAGAVGFPVPFVTFPSVTANYQGGAAGFVTLTIVSTASFQCKVWDANGSDISAVSTINYQAIGRWR